MSDIEIRVDNTEKTIDEKNEAVKIAMLAAANFLEGQAVAEIESDPSRVDTGLLKNSITSGIGGESVSKGSYTADQVPGRHGGKPKKTSGTYSGTLPNDGDTKVSAYVGTNVEYAIYVHEGTTRLRPANRFLRNALQNGQSEAINIIKDILGRN